MGLYLILKGTTHSRVYPQTTNGIYVDNKYLLVSDRYRRDIIKVAISKMGYSEVKKCPI